MHVNILRIISSIRAFVFTSIRYLVIRPSYEQF